MSDNRDLLQLKQRISELTDEQLIEMVTTGAGDYRREALDYARAELRHRRVDWSEPQAEEEEPADTETGPADRLIGPPGSACQVCGGRLRAGTLIAEKELSIIFRDNHEERFIQVMACVQCGQLSLIVDYDTEVDR
jgi:hypothetical protein